MESENFRMSNLKLKKENPFEGKLDDLKLAKGAIKDIDDLVMARNSLADGELDKRLKKANKL